MKHVVLLGLAGIFYTPMAWAQCAPGVPSAGNPGCIPPNQSNSPYHQGNAAPQQQAPAQPQAVWADRWGAIATDAGTGDAGTVEGQKNREKAGSEALATCKSQGAIICNIILYFKNQCAAVAQVQGGARLSAVGSPTQQAAEKLAVTQCNQGDACKIVYSKCSFAERVR